MNSESFEISRNNQLPLNEKYAPRKISDLVLPQLLKTKIANFVKKKNMPNMIFTGPSGVGKTITIECIAHELYGNNFNSYVLKLNASDDKGAKSISDDITTFCRSKISLIKKCKDIDLKLIILNDADRLIERSQPQLSLLMEQFKNNARFVFTCNTSSCIIESIQTKCLKIRFVRVLNDLVVKKLSAICHLEKIKFDQEALKQLSVVSNGDLRCGINFLQIIYNKNGSITLEEVDKLCDMPQKMVIREMIKYALEKNLKESFKILFELLNCGYSGSDITLGMMNTLKSDICNDMPEGVKMSVAHHVAMC